MFCCLLQFVLSCMQWESEGLGLTTLGSNTALIYCVLLYVLSCHTVLSSKSRCCLLLAAVCAVMHAVGVREAGHSHI
jgi:hypothetical protein